MWKEFFLKKILTSAKGVLTHRRTQYLCTPSVIFCCCLRLVQISVYIRLRLTFNKLNLFCQLFTTFSLVILIHGLWHLNKSNCQRNKAIVYCSCSCHNLTVPPFSRVTNWKSSPTFTRFIYVIPYFLSYWLNYNSNFIFSRFIAPFGSLKCHWVVWCRVSPFLC
jgi:hypothetical protein